MQIPKAKLDDVQERGAPEGPWVWRVFGNRLMLVTEHSGAKVILAPERGTHIETRDPVTGVLRQIDPADDVLRMIAAAPDLLDALELIQGFSWQLDDSHAGREIRRRAIAALTKAKGAA